MNNPRFEVTTLGETLLRLSVPAGVRLETASRLDLFPAGAEANVVAALSRLGRQCAWVGSLPEGPLGRFVVNHLAMAGVDTSRTVWGQGRMGLFFVEFAGPPRPTQIHYDRRGSCGARLQASAVDWDFLLDTRLLHMTGITPALSVDCRDLAEDALKRARRAGVAISFDVNYRAKLWSLEEARAVLLPLIQGVEILICSQQDAARVFGIRETGIACMRTLQRQSQAETVVLTLGDSGALALGGEDCYRQAAVPVEIVDRIGAGDALAAGLLDGWMEGDLERGLRQGVVLAALALSQRGDMLVTTREELACLCRQQQSGIHR